MLTTFNVVKVSYGHDGYVVYDRLVNDTVPPCTSLYLLDNEGNDISQRY